MKIIVNGEKTTLADNGLRTISGLLDELKVADALYVTVELNGKILKREDFDSSTVADGDCIEFLYFMGGGQE